MTHEHDSNTATEVRPMYLQIREDLLRELRTRKSSRLPSEREICQKYGVCRPTVHKALSYFIEKNMIVRRPGKGTFFRDNVLHDEPATTGVKIIIRHDWQNWEGDSYFGQAVQGVFGALSHLPFQVGIEKYSEKLKYELLQDGNTAGIWLSPEAEETAAIRELADADRTAVAINRVVGHPGVYWVSSDHEAEGEQAVRHLREMGQRRLTYLCSEADRQIFLSRDLGIRRGLVGSDMVYEPVIFSGSDWQESFERIFTAAVTQTAGHQTILIHNGAILPQAVAILKKYHKRFPDDLSLISFGDNAEAEKSGVTGIRQQVEKLGRLAAEIVAGNHRHTPGKLLPCVLIQRNSVRKI